jgi:predicted O-methyltransferase YrrM
MKMMARRALELRGQGTAELCRGLLRIDHEQLDPGFKRLPVELGAATSVAYDKALIVSRFCALLKPTRVLEIGTYRGGMTLHIARNTDKDCQIWTLDLPRRELANLTEHMIPTDVELARMEVQSVGEEWRNREEATRVRQLWGDSRTFDFAGLGPFQLIYIDGSHARPWVDADTRNAFRLLGPTGAILWDDCLWGDVQRTLAQYAVEKPIYLFEDGHTAGYLQREGKAITA